jgi:hypothetical protein
MTASFGNGSRESFSLTVNVASEPSLTSKAPSVEPGTGVSLVTISDVDGVVVGGVAGGGVVSAAGSSEFPQATLRTANAEISAINKYPFVRNFISSPYKLFMEFPSSRCWWQ